MIYMDSKLICLRQPAAVTSCLKKHAPNLSAAGLNKQVADGRSNLIAIGVGMQLQFALYGRAYVELNIEVIY
jgi:hypothetical protein